MVLSGGGPVSRARLDRESSSRAEPDGASPSIRLDSLELVEVERRVVALALERTSWNIKRAAERLGITRATLYSKIKRYSLRETATTA